MVDSKWSEGKQKYHKNKTKCYHSKRKSSEVERTFQESALKPSQNYK